MRKLTAVAIGIIMVLAVLADGHTAGYTYTDLDYPDPKASLTTPKAINSTGTVVGSYYKAEDGSTHGFIWDQGTFTTVNFTPTATHTTLNGINDDGTIVGTYVVGPYGAAHGFSLTKDGTHTLIDCPSDYPDTTNTIPTGINNEGTIVGYCGANGQQGFSLSSGNFTYINYPDASYGTYVLGVNDSGAVVGYYRKAGGSYFAFSLIDGAYATINYPGSATTPSANGINNHDAIVGYYTTSDGKAYGYMLSGGAYRSFDYPGGYGYTVLTSINTTGLLVGWYYGKDSTNHAFLARPLITLCKLTVTRSAVNKGAGTVSSVPAGIDCGTTCSHQFECGTPVTLAAAPAEGSRFTGWSGGGCSGTGTCAFTIDKATTVKATFSGPVALTVTKANTKGGSGTVTSDGGDINCGTTCKVLYEVGSEVTLTATPSSLSTFTGWSGGGCTGKETCAVTLGKATTVKATFVGPVALTVTKANTKGGSGTVTSDGGDINCGTTCKAAYKLGSPVTLTAVPAQGSTFTGWSGGGCTGTGTCAVTMSKALTVKAGFKGGS